MNFKKQKQKNHSSKKQKSRHNKLLGNLKKKFRYRHMLRKYSK